MRRGRPERELPALAHECDARAVHFSADIAPFARARDDRVKRALSIPVHEHPGTFVVDDLDEIRTTTGKPYTGVHAVLPEVDGAAATREARRTTQAPTAPKGPAERVSPVARRSRPASGGRGAALPGRRDRWANRYRGTIRWRRAHKLFEAWCEGRTGYPMVDAGMRQQQAKHDPDGSYVRTYVPELGSDAPDDYPEPIVNHAQARREALARYPT